MDAKKELEAVKEFMQIPTVRMMIETRNILICSLRRKCRWLVILNMAQVLIILGILSVMLVK